MRNLSLFSILLALAIAAVAWQQMSRRILPDIKPEVVTESRDGISDSETGMEADECSEDVGEAVSCQETKQETVYDEVEQYRQGAHETMMKSFDKEYDKYRRQTGGRP